MRRRDFITLFGGAVASSPLLARAQQPTIPVIGYLTPAAASSDAQAQLLTAFRQGLKETSYVEGQNVAIEYRWADGHYDRLPALAADLARHQVRVIFASANVSAIAAKASTATIPIVFAIGGDPVKLGLVASFNRPGGNLTGVSFLINVLEAKKLQLLHELVPGSTIAALLNPTNPIAGSQSRELQEAAGGLGLQVLVLEASTERELDAAFASTVERGAGALLVTADPFFTRHRDRIVAP